MASAIYLLTRLLSFLVIIHVILSYLMSPYHPIRQTIDSVVEPMLAPLRGLIPSAGGLDFSPLALILIIQLVGNLLINAF
ncbi:MAG: YggT family protein [Chloroflexi bacterium]|nr:YggT family protein [Chloroflexota bacterium]